MRGLVRRTFELSAPGQHTLRELAAALEPVLGRPIRAEQVDIASYGPAQALPGSPYPADGFPRLRRHYDAHGFHGGNALVLSILLGRPPRDFATCAHHLHHHPTEQNARTP